MTMTMMIIINSLYYARSRRGGKEVVFVLYSVSIPSLSLPLPLPHPPLSIGNITSSFFRETVTPVTLTTHIYNKDCIDPTNPLHCGI